MSTRALCVAAFVAGISFGNLSYGNLISCIREIRLTPIGLSVRPSRRRISWPDPLSLTANPPRRFVRCVERRCFQVYGRPRDYYTIVTQVGPAGFLISV